MLQHAKFRVVKQPPRYVWQNCPLQAMHGNTAISNEAMRGKSAVSSGDVLVITATAR